VRLVVWVEHGQRRLRRVQTELLAAQVKRLGRREQGLRRAPPCQTRGRVQPLPAVPTTAAQDDIANPAGLPYPTLPTLGT